MRNLTKDGKTVIIITHKLQEIRASSDLCTIIRRGKYIDTVKVSETDELSLAAMMVGREVNLHIEKEEAAPGETIFSIENLTVSDYRNIDKVKDLNLQVRKGEILGIAGIDGNGQKELVDAITCLTKAKSGKIRINGNEIQNTTPRNVIDKKVCTIHEDRHRRGLILDFSVELNSVTETYFKEPYSKNGLLHFENIGNHAKDLIKKFDVRPENCEKLLSRALSGGNQQKLIIAREVSENPDLLIAVQPTRGLDVGAIEFVHKALVQQRDDGKAVLLISFELDEIMDLSDRIAVIYDGSIVDIFENDGSVDENKLGLLMAGGK
jgi:simple sugar transport system ATP-binding protein